MIQLDIYLTQIINFLQTVTIKNPFFLESITERTKNSRNISYLANEDNPYYQNIQGIYSLENEPMYINSLESNTAILFNKDFSINYPKTFSIYKLPNNNFFTLCNRYPSQVDLIKAILYPIPNDIDIYNAEDFAILAYDDSIFPEQERTTMVEALKTTVNMFKIRWNIKEFTYEEHYPAIMWSILYYGLFINLVLQRIKNIRTPNVHPLHIWEYLKSKGLKDYRAVLDKDQQIFLYKNINYLLMNKGKNSNLKILSEQLLYKYNVSLNKKSLVLSTANSESDCTLTPLIISEDLYETTTPTQDYNINGCETINTIVSRMYDEGLESEYNDKIIDKRIDRLSKAKQTYYPTKLVEIKKETYNTLFLNLFYKMLLQTIIYRYTQGYLDYNVSISFPLTTINKTLSIGESIALMNYCICREMDITPIHIPNSIYVDKVYKTSIPVIPTHFSYGQYQHQLNHYLDIDATIDSIDINNKLMDNPDEIMDLIDSHFTSYKSHVLEMFRSADTLFHRAMTQFYSSIMYNEYISLDLVPGYSTYDEWFSTDDVLTQSIYTYESNTYKESIYNSLGTQLLNAIISMNKSKHTSISGLNDEQYSKMKALFTQLCSYNIAFLDIDRTIESAAVYVPITTYGYNRSSNTQYESILNNIDFISKSKYKQNMNIDPFIDDEIMAVCAKHKDIIERKSNISRESIFYSSSEQVSIWHIHTDLDTRVTRNYSTTSISHKLN